MRENIEFTLFNAFQSVACNPEWWAVQYLPAWASFVLK